MCVDDNRDICYRMIREEDETHIIESVFVLLICRRLSEAFCENFLCEMT